MNEKQYRKFERNMAMNGNGRLIRPDAMTVDVTSMQGPLASPAVVTLQQPGGLKVLTIGGLTKVEELAGRVAASALPEHDGGNFGELAIECVDIAEAILAECERRRTAPQESASNADGNG